jgi:cell division protein FtsI/penicillin-binding protein 2
MRSWRINLISAFFLLFLAVILSRLIYLQIISYQYWRALAKGQQKIFVTLQGKRGEIFFQDKTPLAVNRNFYLVYAAPNEIKKPEETADSLSQILNLDKNLILEKIKEDSFYEVIKRKISEKEISDLKNLNLPGIYLGQNAGRFYPYENLVSKVSGFVGGDGEGQYGIEGYYEDILKGKEEFFEKEKGPGGYLINSDKSIVKGTDIVLTINYDIQFLAEKLLEKAKEDLNIEEGEIIVISPNSGKILALANFPNYNPNQYSEVEDLGIFQNSASQKLFEPGSVFKPITMAAALDQEKITPQTTYVDEGKVKIGGYTIYNYDERVWGQRTMTEVLEKSINTGAVFAERQIDHQIFLDYIEKFGFFEPTGIDLQGEVFSTNSNLKKGYEVNFATASFGQGIEITSMQLVRAFSAIANGGRLIKPYLVESLAENSTNNKERPIISQKTVSQLTAMMVSVIENGFGKAARIPGYYIAGKTGTAQISWSALRRVDKTGYSEETIQSFVGFAPAFDPQFLILIKLKNPETKTAEYSAVPIFKELAKYIIDLWQIPPDYAP